MTMMRMRSGGLIQTAPTLADKAEFLPSCDERCTTNFCKYYTDATVKSADHACSYRRTILCLNSEAAMEPSSSLAKSCGGM